MSRSRHFVSLSHDHHHGLVLAQLIKKNAPQYRKLPDSPEGKKQYALEFYKNDLLNHFYKEEKILYPYVKGKDQELDTLFGEIIGEHNKIGEIIHSLENNINIEENLNELGLLLDAHIRKEERELFKKIEEVLDENELLSLNRELNKNEI